MIVSRESPFISEVAIAVSFSVAIGIGGFGELSHLRNENLSRRGNMESAAVVEAGCKEFPVESLGVGRWFGSKDVGSPQADIELAFRIECDAADFRWHAFGEGDIFEFKGVFELSGLSKSGQ